MATPTLPSDYNFAPPSAGPSPMAAGLYGVLPAFGALAGTGPMGQVASAVLSLPGLMSQYQTTRDATIRENQDRATALGLVDKYRPYVARPAEFNVDVRVPYVQQAIAHKVAGDENTRRATENAIIKMGSGAQTGAIAPGQVTAFADTIRRAGESSTNMDVGQIWEQAQKEWIANKLGIGRAELERFGINEQLSGDRLKMMIEALLRPYGVVNSAGIGQSIQNTIGQLRQAHAVERSQDIALTASRNSLFGNSIQAGAQFASSAAGAGGGGGISPPGAPGGSWQVPGGGSTGGGPTGWSGV